MQLKDSKIKQLEHELKKKPPPFNPNDVASPDQSKDTLKQTRSETTKILKGHQQITEIP